MGLFDDDFDESAFGADDDSLDFGSNSNGFGDNSDSFGSFDDSGGFGDNGNNSLFSGDADDTNPLTDGSLFDTSDGSSPVMDDGLRLGGNEPTTRNSKKTAIIAIGVGVGIIVVVFILASILLKDKDEDKPTGTVTHNVISVDPNSTNANVNTANGNDVMGEGQKRTQTQVVTQSSNNTDWVRLDDTSGISFNTDYIPAVFVVTGVEHYALKADPNGNLEIKTELTGSISGYSGTYKLTVPYSKGCKLSNGMSFDVQVEIGSYKGKSVIGDIIF